MGTPPPPSSGASSHLEAHHHALNTLLGILRANGAFSLAGQLMQLHPRCDWAGMKLLASQLVNTSRSDEIRTAAEELMDALDAGPLSPGYIPPESR